MPVTESASTAPVVLVVEDNDAFRQALHEILTKRGFEVLLAESADQGVGYLDAVDLVLLDGMLPGRDGWDFCREIRQRYGNALPVVMITARAEPEIRDRSLEAGAVACLVKPFRVGDLMNALHPLVRPATSD